jgi:hypothetical protein
LESALHSTLPRCDQNPMRRHDARARSSACGFAFVETIWLPALETALLRPLSHTCTAKLQNDFGFLAYRARRLSHQGLDGTPRNGRGILPAWERMGPARTAMQFMMPAARMGPQRKVRKYAGDGRGWRIKTNTTPPRGAANGGLGGGVAWRLRFCLSWRECRAHREIY